MRAAVRDHSSSLAIGENIYVSAEDRQGKWLPDKMVAACLLPDGKDTYAQMHMLIEGVRSARVHVYKPAMINKQYHSSPLICPDLLASLVNLMADVCNKPEA